MSAREKTMHITSERVLEGVRTNGGAAEFQLGPNDSGWNPASTKYDILGPAVVTYRQYPDGGISASVSVREGQR